MLGLGALTATPPGKSLWSPKNIQLLLVKWEFFILYFCVNGDINSLMCLYLKEYACNYWIWKWEFVCELEMLYLLVL